MVASLVEDPRSLCGQVIELISVNDVRFVVWDATARVHVEWRLERVPELFLGPEYGRQRCVGIPIALHVFGASHEN